MARPAGWSSAYRGLGSRGSSALITAVRSLGIQSPPQRPPWKRGFAGSSNCRVQRRAAASDAEVLCPEWDRPEPRWPLSDCPLPGAPREALSSCGQATPAAAGVSELRAAPGEGVQQEPQQIPMPWLGSCAGPEAAPAARACTESVLQAQKGLVLEPSSHRV